MKRTYLAASAAAAVALAAAVLTAGGSVGPLRNGAGDGSPAPAPHDPSARTSSAPQQSASIGGTLSGGSGVDPSGTASGDPATAGGPYLVVGSESENRAFAARLSDIRADLHAGVDRLRVRVASAVIGAPWSMVALPHQRLAVTTTNQPELVLLSHGLTKHKTLDLRPAVGAPRGAGTTFRLGALSTNGSRLYVGVAWGNQFAVVAVDIDGWRVAQTRALPGRTAMWAPTCVTGDGRLAVLTTHHLTLLRPDTLATVADVPLDGQPLGLACADSEVFVSDDIAGLVRRIDSSGRPRGTLTWDGKGAGTLHYASGALYGADEETRKVFRCDLAAARCTTSSELKGHTDSLIRSGDLLFAAHDSERFITVMDAGTLAVRGQVPVPDRPRGFALLS